MSDSEKGTASNQTVRNKLGEAGLNFGADVEGNAVVDWGGRSYTIRETSDGFSVSTPGKPTWVRGIKIMRDVVSVIKTGRP